MLVARIALALVAAYLLGGTPFALIISRRHGVDIREHGSGNTGATNVLRVLGTRAGLTVLFLDLIKGTTAVGLTWLLMLGAVEADMLDWVLLGAAMCAVLGHTFSPFIGFRGGKGVATAAGALLPIAPTVWVLLFVSFVLIVYVGRMVSLGSILMAVEFPLLCVLLYPDRTPVVWFSFLAAALVLWRHRSNMARIIHGEETKIGQGVSSEADVEGED